MKLSPPASSSDLEAAREIARRLHQRRRRQDRPGPEKEPEAAGTPRPRSEPLAPPAPPRRPAPLPSTRPPLTTPPAAEPELPSWDDSPSAAPAPTDRADSLVDFGDPGTEPGVLTDPGGEAAPVVEDPGVSPEEMVGSVAAPFEALPEPDAYGAPLSPFEVELDETPEDEGAPGPPSWDDIVETCLGLAQASGAMLVDPAGQVFAARGEWPEPGPDAIAAKLVSTMERTLRDAPTRSISAPLMGRHLTAWRVPLAEGLVTAAFLGDAPVRAETRPAIDTEIHRGAGA